jgi:Zn-finger nucleic acid-binding protein
MNTYCELCAIPVNWFEQTFGTLHKNVLEVAVAGNLEHCCICKTRTETTYSLKFIEVFGMAKEYEQKIDICPQCGFIFTKNPFDAKLLENRYKNLSKFEYGEDNEAMEEDISYKKRCYRQYNFIKESIGKTASIFEVGCASGFNLNIYAEDGINVFGIEPSENNIRSCKEKYGISLFQGMFSEYIESNGNRQQYELIFLSHVLEHIVDPYKFIFELSEINSRYIFVEVPSLDYKFCDEPFEMFAEEHVNYFTYDSLRKLMGTIGYHIVDAKIYFCTGTDIPAGYSCISTIWEKNIFLGQISLTSEMPPVFSGKELLMQYIKKSEGKDERINTIIDGIDDHKRIAIWGTGHHTSRLLGMTNLKKKNIIKFYDSDVRKRGIEFFNRKIQIFNPADLETREIETIIISTFVAQKAIENILLKQGIKNYIKLY